jgi:dipeptidyl aminopeptidase/acylaminoacyl peptidase
MSKTTEENMQRHIFSIFPVMLVTFISLSLHSLQAQTQRIEKGNLIIEEITEIPQRIIDRMYKYQSTRSAAIQDWTADGEGMIISTRFAETTQLHLIESPGGARKQITFFPEPVREAFVSPNLSINGFLFTKDVGGNEFYQIYFCNLSNGEYKLLTDGFSLNGLPNWSNDGKKFVYYGTERDGRNWDIYLTDMDTPDKAKRILEKVGTWVAIDWSPDDKKLLIINYVSANESYYYTLEIATGELTQINPSKEKIAYGLSCLWAKNENGLYMTSDEGSEFLRLRYYDLEQKEITTLTSNIPWDVEQLAISEQGDKLGFVTNENGVSKLYILDTKTKKYEQIPNVPTGQIYNLRFHPDGNRLALVINTPRTPGDIFVVKLDDNSIKRWTYSEVGGLDTESFIVPNLIEYETFDEDNGKPRMIPAFYYKPSKGDGPFPVLINIHGGPESQFIPHFSSTIQYYLNELGIAVIAPNVRGSSGYGKSYLKLDNDYKREDSVKDIGKLLDWIEEQPELDVSRVSVIGGSYGGYMVLASMTHYDERLKCGIDLVGISNFVTFLENTEDYRRDLRRVEYGDERDTKMREFLTRISPLNNAHKITKPMFIAQGLNDPRVPLGESEQIVSAIRNNKGNVWYLLVKDEGHGFSKKSNADYYTNTVVYFLENFLLQ